MTHRIKNWCRGEVVLKNMWISKSTNTIVKSGKQNYFRKPSGIFFIENYPETLSTTSETYPKNSQRIFNVIDIKKK